MYNNSFEELALLLYFRQSYFQCIMFKEMPILHQSIFVKTSYKSLDMPIQKISRKKGPRFWGCKEKCSSCHKDDFPKIDVCGLEKWVSH